MLQMLRDLMMGLLEAGWLVRKKNPRLDLSKPRLPRVAHIRRGQMPVMPRPRRS